MALDDLPPDRMRDELRRTIAERDEYRAAYDTAYHRLCALKRSIGHVHHEVGRTDAERPLPSPHAIREAHLKQRGDL
jgi:hypothetical protein